MRNIKIHKNAKLIISLIKDDLIHTKLVDGLEALGLDALDFHVHLSETVFNLLGFPDNKSTDKTFEYYLTQLKRAKRLSIRRNREAFDLLALAVYYELERRAGYEQ